MLLNVSGEVTRANQAAVDLAGKKFSEVIGRPCWEVFPCTEHGPGRCPHHQTIETGRFSRREELVSVKGHLLECTGNPLCDPSGDLSGTVIVLHDLTERRMAEAATRQLAAIVESSEDAIIGKRLDGTIQTWNRGAEKLYGYTAEEVVGQLVSMLAPPEAAEEIPRILQRVGHGESVQPFETVRVRKDGTRFPVSVTASPILDAHGEVAGAATIARDVSERKRAEERLRESELRFRQIAETISEVFWMADPHITRMLYVSPGYERLWGRSCASLYENPKSFLEAIHPQDREQVRTTLEAQKTGHRFDHEYRIVLPDGSVRWVWDRGFPVCDGSGNVTSYVGVAQDITERKKAELALADQLEELRRWHQAMLDREGRLLDLKREVNELLKQNGNPPRYPSAEQKGS
jgi:PAS domain S-box-containing protein